MSNIGTYHLANDTTNLYEVQRENNFELIVNGIDNLIRSDADINSTATADIIKNGQEVIRMSVIKTSLPHFTQEVIIIKRGNSVMKAAGVPTFGEGSLEINDYTGADGKSVIMAWQGLSYNVNNETIGKMKSYKKDCTLIEYTPDYEQVRYWDLKGCWISGVSEGDANSESGNKKTVTATIQYDKAIMHMPD